MYRIFCNGELISPLYTGDGAHIVYDPKIVLDLNAINYFTFQLQHDHPKRDLLKQRSSYIQVYDDRAEIFRGRVINTELDFKLTLDVEIEHELAFLTDSIYRPHVFRGSVKDYFTQLISNHNSQVDSARQFTVGQVTVTDSNDYILRSSDAAASTWDLIQDKLVKTLGGYIRTRVANGTRYIDYITDYGEISGQNVQFGQNLLDIVIADTSADVKTCLIPYGAEYTTDQSSHEDAPESGTWNGNRLTVASVNDGKDYIEDATGIALYGRVWGTEQWDDVTEAANLLTKGKAWLAEQINRVRSITVDVVDLHLKDPDLPRLELGCWVTAYSRPHNINAKMRITHKELHLNDPADDEITLGVSYKTLTDATAEEAKREQAKTNLTGYATESYVTSSLNGYATENFVTSQIQSAIDATWEASY